MLGSLVAISLLATGCSTEGRDAIRIGAVYPLSGTQGPGGVEEFQGVQVAADLANADGGVRGRAVELVPIDVPAGDAAPSAIEELAGDGVRVVLGSYGSTISAPAAEAAAARGILFWETGAVGEMTAGAQGELVFRVAPTGAVLGRNAIVFVADRYAPVLGLDPATLRYAVTMVDDAYGRAVAAGAIEELEARGYPIATELAYDPHTVDMRSLVEDLAASDPDVLFVSAYLDDAVAMRREMVRQSLDLLVGIGTSSSYCMPAFGAELGDEAVGLFASDKPDANALNPDGLAESARTILGRAEAAYEDRFDEPMTPAALAGFAAAWALFHDVLPAAANATPEAIAAAAAAASLPPGSLPNGSGLRFGAPGTATAGANLEAAGIVWQWQAPDESVSVWPPRFATGELQAIDPLP